MAIIPLKKYTLSTGVLEIESAKVEDSERVISLVKEVEKETNFLSREPGEFRMSIEDERKFIEDRLKNDKEILLTAKVNGEVIGTLGFAVSPLGRHNHKGLFGISILKKYWNQGIGSKLIETMLNWADNNGFVKVNLQVDSDNERAVRLYKRFGFEEEGVLKFDKYLGNGVYKDSIVMTRINYNNLRAKRVL